MTGRYQVSYIGGLLLGVTGLIGWVAFPTLAAPVSRANPTQPISVLADLILTVRETAGIARSGEVVRSGIPLPRSLDVRNPDTLTLVDSGGTPVPAEFQVLARWDGGRDADAPIQWLLVTFPAGVTANGSATYRLVTDGSAGPNPEPSVAISVTQNGNQITVDTGAATFLSGLPATMPVTLMITSRAWRAPLLSITSKWKRRVSATGSGCLPRWTGRVPTLRINF